MASCELCGAPGARKTGWNEYLCDPCFNKKQTVKKNKPAGIA